MKTFLESIDERALVCDGAMGTMLYAKGVFINRCFDALNLTSPGRVGEVHHDYMRAGADVLETNTFGANRIKLRAFGLADSLREINFEGARIAKNVAGERAYVAGAVGPLGIRIEPWGKMGREEAEAYFREQVQALVEGGVDLFILETFRDLNEIGAALAAVRSISELPVVAQVTTEEDGNSLDGTAPERFAPSLQALGADVIGVNCSVGPAPMFETIQRIASACDARLSAQPNAGRPRDVEGRNIYLSSPEYMASYARRFVASGVRLVGGCCGTTPEHIRQISMAVARATATTGPRVSHAGSAVSASDPRVDVVARPDKSRFAKALADARFVRMVELFPAKGFVSDDVVERARTLKARGVDVVYIPDGPRGARMSALSLALLIQKRASMDTVLEYSCRDRNLLGMQSDLLGAYAMGVRNLAVVTGDVRPVGDYPDATAVYDVDSIGLTHVVSRLNHGLDIGGQGIGRPTAFHVGVQVNPGAEDLDAEIRRFEYKVDAGAEFAITRPIFDLGTFERFYARVSSAGVPIIVGLRPFESVVHAEYLANEVPGIRVPDAVLERMRRRRDPEAAAAEGIAIAHELWVALGDVAQGVRLASSADRLESVLAVLDGVE